MSTRKAEHSNQADSTLVSLRQRAEERTCLDDLSESESMSLEDARQLLHELRVNRIELEIQNEELRRTQHELAASRARYFDLYDLAPTGFLTLSEQGLIQEANLAVSTMLGVARKNLFKKPISQFIYPEDQDVYFLQRKKIFERSEVQSWEMRMLRADSSHFWARLQASPAHNGEYWITMIDFTKRKLAEEGLKKSEESLKRQNSLFSALLTNLPMGVFMVEAPSGKPLVANEAAFNLLGRGILPDASRHNLSEVYKAFKTGSRDPYPPGEMPILLGMKGETSHVDNMLVERPDGTETHLEIFGSPVADDQGHIWASLVSFFDITERKQAERVLQSRLRISEYAYDHSLDELLTKVLDEAESLTDSRIGFFHFVESDQVTLSLQTWSSTTLSTICTAEGKGQHYPLDSAGVWADCIRQRKPLIHNSYETLPNRKGLPSGHAPIARELVVPIFRNDLIVAVLGVGNKKNDYTEHEIVTLQILANLAWDIITRKKVEEALNQAKDAAEGASQAKSDFLATMSHEIRTPLGAMLGNIELLEGSPLSPRLQEYLKDCKSASQMLLQVINDILDFSKIEAGKLELVNETFSVSAMCRQLVRMFSAVAKQKGLSLTVSLAGDLPEYICGDQQRLRQIISNLLSNAIKFTSHGAVSLKITCGLKSSPETSDRAELCIVVSDTGIGIPADKQDQIFESFSQVESFKTRRVSGTGLGLAISRRLLALMGGQIAVSSAADEGSVFTVILPVILGQAPSQTQAHALETFPDSMPARKILLADDDQKGRAVAQKLLERSGYTVTAVENGSELLDALQQGGFDIVLTDISMPDMEGTQVARIIRSEERAGIDPCVPIIAMTAHALAEDRDRFLASGIDGFVAKPFNFADLLRQIEELCRGRVK